MSALVINIEKSDAPGSGAIATPFQSSPQPTPTTTQQTRPPLRKMATSPNAGGGIGRDGLSVSISIPASPSNAQIGGASLFTPLPMAHPSYVTASGGLTSGGGTSPRMPGLGRIPSMSLGGDRPTTPNAAARPTTPGGSLRLSTPSGSSGATLSVKTVNNTVSLMHRQKRSAATAALTRWQVSAHPLVDENSALRKRIEELEEQLAHSLLDASPVLSKFTRNQNSNTSQSTQSIPSTLPPPQSTPPPAPPPAAAVHVTPPTLGQSRGVSSLNPPPLLATVTPLFPPPKHLSPTSMTAQAFAFVMADQPLLPTSGSPTNDEPNGLNTTTQSGGSPDRPMTVQQNRSLVSARGVSTPSPAVQQQQTLARLAANLPSPNKKAVLSTLKGLISTRPKDSPPPAAPAPAPAESIDEQKTMAYASVVSRDDSEEREEERRAAAEAAAAEAAARAGTQWTFKHTQRPKSEKGYSAAFAPRTPSRHGAPAASASSVWRGAPSTNRPATVDPRMLRSSASDASLNRSRPATASDSGENRNTYGSSVHAQMLRDARFDAAMVVKRAKAIASSPSKGGSPQRPGTVPTADSKWFKFNPFLASDEKQHPNRMYKSSLVVVAFSPASHCSPMCHVLCGSAGIASRFVAGAIAYVYETVGCSALDSQKSEI